LGGRAPDAPCRGAGGQPTRLFDLFRGPHWTLLGFDAEDAPAPRFNLHIHMIGKRGDIVDDAGHIHAAYGLDRGWVLVRPDGYISAIAGPGDLPALAAHIDKIGVR
jgi:hypothetical protein